MFVAIIELWTTYLRNYMQLTVVYQQCVVAYFGVDI